MIEDYNFIRSDHLSNTKRVGVCIYYKEPLVVRIVNINSLTECLLCEVIIQNRKGYVVVVHRSPSQSTSEFESFFLVWRTCLVIHFVQNPSSLSL